MAEFEVKKIRPAHEDERGQIIDLVDGEEFQHAGIVTIKPGFVRAKHYHKLSSQYNYVLRGRVRFVLKDMKNKNAKPEAHILEKGDMVLLPAFCYHSLEALEDSEILFFTTNARHGSVDYEKDTYRIAL